MKQRMRRRAPFGLLLLTVLAGAIVLAPAGTASGRGTGSTIIKIRSNRHPHFVVPDGGVPTGTNLRIVNKTDPHQIGPGALWLAGPTGIYSTPTPGTFGNTGVGIRPGPGMVRFDMSLGKKFNIMEHRYIEIRGEAFNLSNTPIFASPASQTISSSLFGQIRSSQGERSVQLVGKFYF